VRGARVALSLLVLVFAPAGAHAQTKEACVAAFDRGQELRDRKKLRAAREQFVECARDACPAPLRKDCAERLDEVTRDLPTIVLAARDGRGEELTGFRVFIDQEPAKIDESGLSVPVDPGAHVVRFEDGSGAEVSLRVIFHMGERNRPVVAVFANHAPPPPPEQGPPSGGTPRPLVWAYIAMGLGIVGLGAFTGLGISGYTEKQRLLGSCGHACNDEQVSTVKSRYIAADVSLGVGVASLALAAYLFLSQPPTPRKQSVSGAL
jgi:hypothetical protein